MIRTLVIFAALFVVATACISLLPSPPRTVTPPSYVAAQLREEAQPAAAQARVRVVYPASGSNNGPGQPTQSSSVDTAAAAEPTPSSAVGQASAVYPQVQSGKSDDPSEKVAPDAAALTGSAGLNLNTASVDALNQIPGAGHIGRTIASHRPYRSVEDLLTKRVIRKSVYDKIKAQVAAE